MHSRNITIVILFLAAIAAGYWGWTQYQRANALETKNATLTKDLQNTVRDAQRRVAARASADTPAQPAPDTAPPPRAQFQAAPANFRNLMQSPAAQKLMASQQRAMLDTRYAPLFKSLNLTPDQLAKFKDLLVDKQNAARDVMTVAREQGLTDRSEIQQLIQQAQADVDNNIASAIGQDKLAQYQNYDQTAPQRAVVSQIAQSLSYTSDPLTPAQNDQLVALLAQNAPQNNNGGNFMFAMRGPGGVAMQFGGQNVPITNDVINAAQSFLNPNQLDALRQMQSQQSDQQQLQQMFQPGNGGNDGGGGGNNGYAPRGRRGGRGGRGGGGN